MNIIALKDVTFAVVKRKPEKLKKKKSSPSFPHILQTN